MNRIARLIALGAGLLLLFLAAVFVSQRWLRDKTELVRQDVLKTRRIQFQRTLALAHPPAWPWNDAFIRSLEQAIDATVISVSPEAHVDARTGAAMPTSRWQFEEPIKNDAGETVAWARVTLSPPPLVQLVAGSQRLVGTLMVLAVCLVATFFAAVLLSLRNAQSSTDAPVHLAAARAEMGSLTHLARVSAQQGTALERERNERLRAEEDLHFQQVLLNRALEEKIRLGRDLHDGLIQTLYATGLTLEAAKNQIAENPTEARRHLDSSLQTLNTAIRDVRGYIGGLGPENLRHQKFSEAVRSLTQTLDPTQTVRFDLRIDDEAAARLSEAQLTDLLQITREALSNSLRHGGSSEVVVRLHENGGELCLLIQDNGRGFDPNKPAAAQPLEGGHGLTNMRARATRVGAKLRCTSSPGAGTRLVLTLSIVTPAAS